MNKVWIGLLALTSISTVGVFIIAAVSAPTLPMKKPESAHTHSMPLANMETDPNSKFGFYEGDVEVKWLSDGHMKLLKSFSYTDPNNLKWTAPAGLEIDGASIPPMFWSIIGAPYTGKYRAASVIHDAACIEKRYPSPMVHETFYFAMKASQVPEPQAKLMYAAVSNFGPHWKIKKDGTRSAIEVKNQLTLKQFEQLKEAIKTSERAGQGMSLDEIREFKP